MQKRDIMIPVGIAAVDAIIKEYMDKNMTEQDQRDIAGGAIRLRKYYNNGAMLNLLEKCPGHIRTLQAAVMAVALVTYGEMIERGEAKWERIGMGFLIGGGMSNLIDRLTKEHVVDYFSLNVKNKKLREIVFNISDLFVFAGSLMLLFEKIRKE